MSRWRALRAAPRDERKSDRQESNLPNTAYQTVALPPGPRPEKRPVRDSNPSHLLDRQAATPAASQGNQSVRRESHPPLRRGRSVPGLLGHGHERQYPWQESNLHNLRLRRAACLRHTPGMIISTPARSRTWASTFGESRDVRFTTRAQANSGGWNRANTCGVKARRPAVRRPRNGSAARRGFDPLFPA